MSRDDIIRMAREAGLLVVTPIPDDSVFVADLASFAALDAAAEREDCAKICDNYSEFRWSWWKALADPLERAASDAADGLAQCIRNRT
jgi:hypothetical protein